jgi:hypothetical protein
MAKAKKTDSRKEEEPRRKWSLIRFIRTWTITLVLVTIICYTGLYFSVKTDGFRFLIAERVSPLVGVPVRIDDSWMDPDFQLHFRGMVCTDTNKIVSETLLIRDIDIEWSLAGLFDSEKPAIREIHLRGVDLTLAQDSEGQWLPQSMTNLVVMAQTFDVEQVAQGLKRGLLLPEQPAPDTPSDSDSEGLSDVLKLTPLKAKSNQLPFRLVVEDAGVLWMDRLGVEWAKVEQMNLLLAPIPDGKTPRMHCVFSSGKLVTPDDIGLEKFEVEFTFSQSELTMLDHKAPLPRYNVSKYNLFADAPSERPADWVSRAIPEPPIPNPDGSPETAEGEVPVINTPVDMEAIREAIREALEE